MSEEITITKQIVLLLLFTIITLSVSGCSFDIGKSIENEKSDNNYATASSTSRVNIISRNISVMRDETINKTSDTLN